MPDDRLWIPFEPFYRKHMESFARVFSSAKAAQFPPDLRAQLTKVQPLYLAESLYASYVKREPNEYTHNSSRASIAITPTYRLVVIAAGHKQIDIPLGDPKWRNGLTVWTEKQGSRIHFKTDLRYYGTGMGGASLEIRAETKDADAIMRIIEEGSKGGKAAEANRQSQPPPYPGPPQYHEAPPAGPSELPAGQRYSTQELPAGPSYQGYPVAAELQATQPIIRRNPLQ